MLAGKERFVSSMHCPDLLTGIPVSLRTENEMMCYVCKSVRPVLESADANEASTTDASAEAPQEEALGRKGTKKKGRGEAADEDLDALLAQFGVNTDAAAGMFICYPFPISACMSDWQRSLLLYSMTV